MNIADYKMVYGNPWDSQYLSCLVVKYDESSCLLAFLFVERNLKKYRKKCRKLEWNMIILNHTKEKSLKNTPFKKPLFTAS